LCLRIHLAQRDPESQGPVTGGQLGSGHTTPLETSQQAEP
jgi:hypothetical protein